MSMILTWIPPEIDMGSYIGSRHARLFDAGLNEMHFDQFAKLFVQSLQTVDGISQADVDEASEVLTSLRPIFANGAAAARERKEAKEVEEKKKGQLIRYGMPAAAVTALVVVALASVAMKKKK